MVGPPLGNVKLVNAGFAPSQTITSVPIVPALNSGETVIVIDGV